MRSAIRAMGGLALALALSVSGHAQPVAPVYKDTAGQIRSADGMFCITTAGTECSFGSGGSIPTGTAGSPNTAVVTVQGIIGGTNQNVAVQSSVLPTGAATSALQTQISGQIPASLGAKASASSLSVTPATDATFATASNTTTVTLGDALSKTVNIPTNSSGGGTFTRSTLYLNNGTTVDLARTLQATDMAAGFGVQAMGAVPTSAASQALAPVTTAGSATNILKATPGNLYSINLVNNTTAIFVVAYDATSAPTSGTALTTANIRYCFPVAASAGFDKVFQIPARFTAGITLLASTSCTTYTTPATLPVTFSGQFQ